VYGSREPSFTEFMAPGNTTQSLSRVSPYPFRGGGGENQPMSFRGKDMERGRVESGKGLSKRKIIRMKGPWKVAG
jgi:hypothetical protein